MSVSLAQSSAGETTLAGSSIPVDVNIINSRNAITPIPVNSPYSFSTNIGNFDVFVDISFYNKADPLYAESFTSYSLDAWIVLKRYSKYPNRLYVSTVDHLKKKWKSTYRWLSNYYQSNHSHYLV